MNVQIGSGNSTSDDRSVVKSIRGYAYYVDDIEVTNSTMWLLIAGGINSYIGLVDIIVTAITVFEDVCLSTPCQNEGTCRLTISGYQCECNDPFTGQNCEIEDVCLSMPCENGGTCRLNNSSYQCDCNDPFTGQDCEIEDVCLSMPCENGGTCRQNNSSYQCECIDPLTGQNCEIKDVCLSAPCQNEGTCGLTISGYQCACNDPFTGQNCEIEDVCLSMPCENGGTCRLNSSSYDCDCNDPFTGQNCEIEDVCLSMPCENGGTCRRNNNSYQCECTEPFTGQNCEVEDVCLSAPCQNEGTCGLTISGYQCACNNPFTGQNCEIEEVCLSMPCENGGTCQLNNNSYQCECTDPFIGQNCEVEDVCLSAPCQNEGTCGLTNTGYQCDCDDLFAGQNCEIEDVCLSMPCENGGTCRLIDSSYNCDCNDPFSGQNCEIEDVCLSMPCQNGGTCRRNNRSYQCECTDSFTGQNCEIDPCTKQDPCVNGVCRNIGKGQYLCECQIHFEGTNCSEPVLPIEISIHPLSQIVNINAVVEISCGFNNFKKYSWYKDDVLLPNTENENLLIIPNVSLDDIGYYFCRGYGRGGKTLDTMPASVYIKGLTNVRVSNARFVIPFRDELNDQTSELYRETTSNISTFMEQGLRTSTGLVGLSVVCRALRPGSIKADMNIYIEQTNMTAFETQDLIGQSLDGLSHDSNGFFDSTIISVQNNAICQNITWMSPRFGRVDFPVGENGTWANSTGLCPFNTTHAYEPVGRALCTGDGINQSEWIPMDNCGPFRNVTDILIEIVKENVTEDNAAEVSQQVSVVTSNIEQITSNDITFVAEITSQIVQQNVTSEEVTESITSIVSNIAQVDAEELEAAEEENRAVSQFVQAFEEQISRVAVADGEMVNIQQPNIAVQVQSVPNDDVMSGLVLSVAGSSLSDLTDSNITINAQTQNEVTPARPDIIAQVNIPPSVSSVISSTSPESQSNATDHVRVAFNIFSTPVLFISRSLRNFSAANEDFNRSANSPVISLSLGQRKVEALTEFINFTFITIMSGYVNPMCSFWDENDRDWSQDGCVLVSSSGLTSFDGSFSDFRREDSNDERVRCACDHLTNFAVIMDIHRQPEEDPLIEAYSTLTYIGCGISIFSLLVTLATYLWHKDLRTKQANQIFICLCLTMLCLYTTFIIMISLDSKRDYREVQLVPCGVLTALIHYFVLSSVAWMGVEGFNTYLVIVKIFNTYIPNFMLKASLAAWGVPAIVVVLTGAIARDHYAYGDQCFLQLWAQIGGLMIPISIILLINTVIFILVVRRLIRSASMAGRVKSDSKAQRRETIQRVQSAICILLLLGLTWVSGYLLLIPEFSQVAQPIFIVLNSFQGMFIFLLYCVRKPQIRKKWGLTCCDKLAHNESSTSSGTQSSKNPSSFPGAISGFPGASDINQLSTKDDQPDPLCMYNPTYDVDEVDEGIKPTIKYLPSSDNGKKIDTDGDAGESDAAMVSLHVGASATMATAASEDRDGVASTPDDAAVSIAMESTDAINGD